MVNIIFYIILFILFGNYILERWLDYLNSTRWSNELPKEVEGIYDADKYRKQQEYQKTNTRFGIFTDTLTLIVMLALIVLGGFAWLDDFLRQYTNHPIILALFFFGILGLAADILSTPLSVYHIFVIEQKFGFNQTSIKTFIFDKLKGWLLGAIIGGGLLAIIVWIYQSTGNWFWLVAWIVISVFSIFMTMFYATLIVPLFNKQTPLEDGELRSAIEKFATKTGFRLDNIFVIDGSKRSKKSNAYFSGLGSKKRIVLYDTLIKQHTTDELVAVLAHEIGHYQLKHTRTGVILSILQTGLTLYILSWFIGNPLLSQALGAEQGSFHLGILAFGILYTPLSLILGLAMNIISRRHEFQADSFAGRKYNVSSLQSALKKLSVDNLSNLRPHPAYVFFYYSHPPLLERLKNLESIKK